MTVKEMIGRYFENGNGIIKINDIHNEYIYDYVECDIDEDGNVVDTTKKGYVTPKELKHYQEI